MPVDFVIGRAPEEVGGSTLMLPMAYPETTPRRSRARTDAFIDLQTGYPLVAFLALTSIATLSWTWFAGPQIVATLLLLLQAMAMICFCTQRIRIDGYNLEWQFGPGWIRGRIPLSQVTTTHLLMTPFAYGWGFRRTIHGWRFIGAGALALEIHCRSGKRLRFGTPRAHELQHAIENARGRRHSFS